MQTLTIASDDPRIGTIASDRYRIVRRLAEGGMGVVYEAEHLEIRRRVAIKCLHPHLATQPDVVTRFRREAQAAAAIGNEHIVDVLDMDRFDGDGPFYMVLEYLEGHDLARDIAEGGPLRVGRAVHVLSQICDALSVAHDKGIVHRDLKPENVFLVERHGDRDFVKVLDFGISKVRDALDGTPSSMTKTGTTVGTPYYMAPEQAQGRRDIDHRVDVYALGVILFRALTGEHPFDDESYPMLVLKICTEAPPPVRRWRQDVPAGLEAVIARMLAKEPAHRFSDTREVRRALEPFASIDEPPALTGAPGTRTVRASALSGGRVDSPLARAPTEPASVPAAGEPWQSGPGVASAARQPDPGDDGAAPSERPAGLPPPGAGVAVRWVLLGAALLAMALLVVLALTTERDAPVDRSALLPDPAPPVTAPLIAPGGGDVGWMWTNPLPRAMPSWYDVDVAGRDLIAMVGFAGGAARLEAGHMYRWPTDTEESLHGVAWTGRSEALAVGDAGTIRVLRTTGEPLPVVSGTDVALRDVLATSPTEAWVVGDGGLLLRLDAYRAQPVETGTDRDLLALAARGDAIFVVGEGGLVLRIVEGRVHREESGTQVTLRGVGGCPGGALYAVGDEGRVLRRDAEGRWEPLQITEREPFAQVACDGARAAAVGLRGGVLLIAERRTVRLESGTDRSLHGIGSGRGSETWIVGDGGQLMKLAGDHVVTLTAGPTGPVQDMAHIGGALVAVGEWGRILRQREEGFVLGRSPTKAALAGVARLGPDRLLAVGDHGAMVSIGFEDAELVDSPTTESLRGVVSDGESVLAVGTEGILVRGVPGAFEVTQVRDAGTLWGVAGRPGSAVAVGDAGLVLRIGERGAQPIPCDLRQGLRGVTRTPDGTWAVGEQGLIVRVEEDRCVVERPPEVGAPTLEGIGPGPEGRPIAVGQRGTVLERRGEGDFVPVELDVGTHLRNVVRTDRDVYIVGAGGVILRHVRLDGSAE